MKWEFTYWLLFLCCLSLGKTEVKDAEMLDIWCLDDSLKSQEDLMRRVGDGLHNCKFEEVIQYPFSYGAVQTPAAPELLSGHAEVYNTSDANPTKQIAVFISWKYKNEYFKSVEQYHLEVNCMSIPGLNQQFLFTWDNNLLEATQNSTATYLQFHFIYVGREGEYDIKPKYEYAMRLQGLPMYAANAEPQDAETMITIESCDVSTEIRQSTPCDGQRTCQPGEIYWNEMCIQLTYERNERPDIEENKPTESYSVHKTRQAGGPEMVLALTGASVAFVAFIASYIWCMKRKSCTAYSKTPQDLERARILLVCTKDSRFTDAINQLIEMISKIPNVQVTCNLRQRTEIGMHGIQEWTKNEVKSSDVICFVVANQFETSRFGDAKTESSRLEDVEKYQIAIMICATETMVVNKAFEDSRKKFIVLDLSSCVEKESLPYFTRFKLPVDLKRFMKALPGRISDLPKEKMDTEKKVFLNLLSNAQLGFTHVISRYDEDAVDSNGIDCNIKHNNLGDEDYCFQENELEIRNNFSLNIPPSAPSSLELSKSNNFNHSNEVEQPRFIEAGARPKQTNC